MNNVQTLDQWLAKRAEEIELKRHKLLAELNATVGALKEIELARAYLNTLESNAVAVTADEVVDHD